MRKVILGLVAAAGCITGPKPGYAYMTTAGSGAMKITPDIVGAIAARVAGTIAAVSGLASRT